MYNTYSFIVTHFLITGTTGNDFNNDDISVLLARIHDHNMKLSSVQKRAAHGNVNIGKWKGMEILTMSRKGQF